MQNNRTSTKRRLYKTRKPYYGRENHAMPL